FPAVFLGGILATREVSRQVVQVVVANLVRTEGRHLRPWLVLMRKADVLGDPLGGAPRPDRRQLRSAWSAYSRRSRRSARWSRRAARTAGRSGWHQPRGHTRQTARRAELVAVGAIVVGVHFLPGREFVSAGQQGENFLG